MDFANLVRLFALAAIWGGSFLFMRIAAPVLGPLWLVEVRLATGALFLLVVSLALGKRLDVRANARHFIVLGALNAALPFALLAYAAMTISASLLSVLNATAPIWGAAVAAIVSRRRPAGKTLIGLGVGVAGVALLVGLDPAALRPGAGLAVAAAVGAALLYGVASVYARTAPKLDAHANAQGCLWAAAALAAPAMPFVAPPAMPSLGIAAAVLALGVACSGVAYLLYFRLIDEVGPAPALTVTFLIPLFGMLWGTLFLGEAIGWHTAAGGSAVLLGTALVTGFSPRAAFAARQAAHA